MRKQLQDKVTVTKRWGRVDILVNNAGVLRDRSYARRPRRGRCWLFPILRAMRARL